MRLLCLADMSHAKSAGRWFYIPGFWWKRFKVKHHVSKSAKSVGLKFSLVSEHQHNTTAILCSLRCDYYFCSSFGVVRTARAERQQLRHVRILHVHRNLAGFQETHCTFMVWQLASLFLTSHLLVPIFFFLSCRMSLFCTRGTNHCHHAAKTNACNLQPRRWSLLFQLPSEDMGLGSARCGSDDGALITPRLNLCVINQKVDLKDNGCVDVPHPRLIAVREPGSFSGHWSVSVSSPAISLRVVGRETKFVAAVCITLSSRCDTVWTGGKREHRFCLCVLHMCRYAPRGARDSFFKSACVQDQAETESFDTVSY